jgi:hypothetical protein
VWYYQKSGVMSVETSLSSKAWYLKFPHDGTGTSRHNATQPFFEQGADAAADPAMQHIMEKFEGLIASKLS